MQDCLQPPPCPFSNWGNHLRVQHWRHVSMKGFHPRPQHLSSTKGFHPRLQHLSSTKDFHLPLSSMKGFRLPFSSKMGLRLLPPHPFSRLVNRYLPSSMKGTLGARQVNPLLRASS